MNIIKENIETIILTLALIFSASLAFSIAMNYEPRYTSYNLNNGDKCINGFEYFHYYKGYSLALDQDTAKPIKCDRNISK